MILSTDSVEAYCIISRGLRFFAVVNLGLEETGFGEWLVPELSCWSCICDDRSTLLRVDLFLEIKLLLLDYFVVYAA